MLQLNFDPRAHELQEAAAPPAAPFADMNSTVREIARVFRRRQWIIVCTTAAVVCLALIFILVVTPRYTGTATVLVDPHRSHVVDNNDQPPRPDFGSDGAIIESQVSVIQSVAVLQRVVNELKLYQDPEFGPRSSFLDSILDLFSTAAPSSQSPEDVAKAKTVEFLANKRLKVSRQGLAYIIGIDASSESPEKAAKIANAIADSYLGELIKGKNDTNKIAASWLNRQLDDLKSRVLASDKAVEEFRATNSLITTQGQTVNDQQLTDLNNKLIDAHVQTAEAGSRFEQVQNIVKTKADPGTLGQALASEVIKQLRTQYADVAKNVADLSSKYGPQHPLVMNAHAQLRATQRLIDQEVQRILDNTRDAYQVAQSREQALKTSLERLQSTSTDSNKSQVRLRELQREADANRTLYESFLARYKETSAQESLDLPDSRIVSRADIPIRPSFPKTALILALSVLQGLVLGAILAFVADRLDRRVKSSRQARDITKVPTLGVIPLVGTRELALRAYRGRKALDQYDPNSTAMLPAVMQPPLMRYALEEPTSLFAEAVRSVRLAIQQSSRNESAKLIMVSSSVDGEGKTTLAVNLALSFAAVGMRTLLVEGDLRNPEMTRSLCPRAKFGLVELAASRVPFRKAALIDQTTGLAILPSPPRLKAAHLNEFVFSDLMSHLLDQLRNHFDFIVIDSPPLVPLVDARALGELADRIVLAIRWNATPQEVVGQALECLGPVQGRLLGTVLTRVDLRRLRFYDYYRSSSYMEPYSYLGQPHVEPAP
jgi:succinoglycan biosynthesis transport protein ExoP